MTEKNPYEYESGYQPKYGEYGYQQPRYELYNPGPKFETEAEAKAEAEAYCKNEAKFRNIFLGLASLTAAGVGLFGVPIQVAPYFFSLACTGATIRRTSGDGEMYDRCVDERFAKSKPK